MLSGLNLTTCDSYFMILVDIFTNHILAESTYFANQIEWTEHSIMVWKPSNKYQIIWQCHSFKNILIDDHSFFTESFFTEAKLKRWEN